MPIPRRIGPQVQRAPERALVRPPESDFAQVAGSIAPGLGRAGEILQRESARMDERRVDEGDLSFTTKLDEAFGALRTKRGVDAAKGLDEFSDHLALAMSEVEAGLGNERQQALFRARAERAAQAARRQASAYALAESEREDAATFDALMQRDLDAVRGEAGDSEAVSLRLQGMHERVLKYGDRAGWSPERMDQAATEARSAARLGQVTALADAEAVDAAEAVLQQHSGQMTADDKARARQVVDTAAIAKRSQEATESLVATHRDDEAAALRAAREQYEGAMEDAVVQRLKVRYGEIDGAKKAAHEAQFAEAEKMAVAGREVPASIRANLTLAENRALDSYSLAPVNDNATWLDFRELTATQLAEMPNSEFRVWWSKLSTAHRDNAERMREEAQGAAQGGQSALSSLESANEMLRQSALRANGLPPLATPSNLSPDNQKKVAQFEDVAKQQIWVAETEKKRKLTPPEMQQVLDGLTREVFRVEQSRVRKFGGLMMGPTGPIILPSVRTTRRDVKGFELTREDLPNVVGIAIDNIPSTDAQVIRNWLGGNGVDAPSDDMVEQVYAAWRFEGQAAALAKVTEMAARQRLMGRP